MRYSLFIFWLLPLMFMISCNNKKEEGKDQKAISSTPKRFELGLAQWSFNKTLFEKKMDNLDFAKKAAQMGFTGIEYVNQFFKDKAQDTAYLNKMNAAAKAANIQQLLIMIDGEGDLGDLNEVKRKQAVENHKKWVDAARYLNCHSIRVNAHGEGKAEEVFAQAKKSMVELSTYAATKQINVIIENHGSYSSDGNWISRLMKEVNMRNAGLLPDFGNFCLRRESGKLWDGKCLEEYDKYIGVQQMMPWAKSVSAKSYDFDAKGDETTIDFKKMLDIVKAADYTGYISVEFEGSKLGEEDGIKATKALIEKYLK
jgi:sugar phosphate isomerase/epimerase